uniref:Cell division protein FtsZ n=2 Tax=Paramagnetospirillum magnetotacticum TaxID=188 RepID=G0ZPK0_PARME|nr:tubulin-like protein [Paramagnetospirillum magnetotacticum]
MSLPKPAALSANLPNIKVFGVGCAGCIAINHMIGCGLTGVEFISANTDAMSLDESCAKSRIFLGPAIPVLCGGRVTPYRGRVAAEKSFDEIVGQIQGANIVFIAAGMGGSTGSGAAPVIAKAAREQGILTVGVVTKPFHFEGAHRMRTAEQGIEELHQCIDTLIIIPNQRLFHVATERTTFADAFKMSDDALYSCVRSVTDLMIMPGLINRDFADIRTVMSAMGKAMMGTGEAEGVKRAVEATEAAICSPLLHFNSINWAKGGLINITGGMDMTLLEVDEVANRIRDEVDPEANIIFGSAFDEKLNGKIRVSVIVSDTERVVIQI